MKNFDIRFRLADSEYMTAVRLAVGAVCAAADVNIDSAEDMKVCVTESCLILKGCGFESVKISLGIGGGVNAEIEGLGGSPVESDIDFSLALVSALVADCTLEKTDGVISKLTLKL